MNDQILKTANRIKEIYDSATDAEEIIYLGSKLAIDILIEVGQLPESERIPD